MRGKVVPFSGQSTELSSEKLEYLSRTHFGWGRSLFLYGECSFPDDYCTLDESTIPLPALHRHWTVLTARIHLPYVWSRSGV